MIAPQPAPATDPDVWDAVVVGAGPAGASCAASLARLGWRVLLADRQTFPRDKACGCCLNAAAIAELDRLGLDLATLRAAGEPFHSLQIRCASAAARVHLPAGLACSRRALDLALIDHACACGAIVRPGWTVRHTARAPPGRVLLAQTPTGAVRLRTRLVVAADGLGGAIARDAGLAARRARTALVGVSVDLPAHPAVEPGTILMVVGPTGYAGLVRAGADRVRLAAAVDPSAVRRAPGPARAVRGILRSAGLDLSDHPPRSAWLGTPPLTIRRNIVAQPHLVLIGDAAGYAEPLTGQGIAWALASGRAVARLAHAHRASLHLLHRAWQEMFDRSLRPAHQRCWAITRPLRWAAVTRTILLASPMLTPCADALALRLAQERTP